MTEEIEGIKNAVPPVEDKGDAPSETPISGPKRRGRPPKNPPANGDPHPVTEDGKSTRGRPKGSGRKSKVTFSSDDISTLGKQIEGLHKLAFMATGIPELEIREDEAQMLGAAVANVAQEYGLELNGKAGAMLQLIAACGMIYVPRFMKLQARVAEAKKQPRKNFDVIESGQSTPSN